VSYFRRSMGDDGPKPDGLVQGGFFDWFTDFFEKGAAESPPIISQPSDGTVILYPSTGPGPGGGAAPSSSSSAGGMSASTKKMLVGGAVFVGAVVLVGAVMKGRR